MSFSDILSSSAMEAWDGSFLASLPERASRALMDTALELEAASGQIIYHEVHEPGSAFMALVARGVIRVYVSSRDGREVTIRYAKRGDVLGIPAVIAYGTPTGVQALTESRVVQMQVRTLRHLVRTDPEVAWAVSRNLTELLSGVIETLSGNVFRPVRERVAHALLEMAHSEAELLIVSATQQEIADAIGSVREVVARTLRQLRDDGLVDRGAHRLVLRDPEALARIASSDCRPGPVTTTREPSGARSLV